MHKGPNTTLDEGQTLIPSGGGFDDGNIAGQIDWRTANSDAGAVAQTLKTDLAHSSGPCVAFHPTQDPISHADGSTHTMGTGSKQGCATVAVAFNDVAGTLKDRGGNHAGNGAEEADRIVGCRDVAQAITQNYGKQPDNSDTALGPNVVSFRNGNSAQSRSLGESENLSPTLPSESGGNKVCVSFAQNQLGEVRTGDVAGTVNTNSNASGRNTAMAQVAMSVRRLTPTECERLQGFPDGWTERAGETAFSDSTRYKMLGNAVCRNVGEWLALRIKK